MKKISNTKSLKLDTQTLMLSTVLVLSDNQLARVGGASAGYNSCLRVLYPTSSAC